MASGSDPVAYRANSINLDPTNGETPLSANPYQGGGGGAPGASTDHAFRDFVAQFGRNPTQSELSMLNSAYATGDPNIGDDVRGKATIAQYYNNQSNTPANLYATQQKQWQQQAPQHYDNINQMTQSLLGRAATQDELSHYGTLIASGQADPYQIQQFIQATPEYQNAQDTQFRSGVDTTLQKSDSDFFNTQKGNIAQQYAQMGRATSPALDVALTQLASQLNNNRSNYLAQLSASQYGGNKANAVSNYNTTQNDVAGRINQNTAGIYGNNQAMTQRLQGIQDYNTQRSTYMDALNKQNKPGWMDYLNTGLNVAKTGAQVYSAM